MTFKGPHMFSIVTTLSSDIFPTIVDGSMDAGSVDMEGHGNSATVSRKPHYSRFVFTDEKSHVQSW